MSLGVIILAGGASSRMGEDKARLAWNGKGAVARLAEVARDLDAGVIVTAGGGDFGLTRVDDGEVGGGPVAGIRAGLAVLGEAGCWRALILAVDAPTLVPMDLERLLASPAPGAAYDGLNLPLVIDVAAVPPGASAGWSVRRLIETAGLARPPCAPDAAERLRGANTPQERARLLEALVDAENARKFGDS